MIRHVSLIRLWKLPKLNWLHSIVGKCNLNKSIGYHWFHLLAQYYESGSQTGEVQKPISNHPKFVYETRRASYTKHYELPNTRFINYMSFGLDAAITLDFHNERIRDPSKRRGRLRHEIGPPLKVLGDDLPLSISTRWFRKTTTRTFLGRRYLEKSLFFRRQFESGTLLPNPYASQRMMHVHSGNLSDRCSFSRSTTLPATPRCFEVAFIVV